MYIKLFCLLSALALLTGCDTAERKLTKICENNILERLRSPSGYKRISVETQKQKITKESYYAYAKDNNIDLSEAEIRILDAIDQQSGLYVLSATLEYDAPNGYGALIRETSYCEVVPYGNDPKYLDENDVYTDGQTKLDYSLNKLNELAGSAPNFRKPFL